MAPALIAPALPGLQAEFADVPRADLLVRLVLTTPALCVIVAAPVLGALIDRAGRRGVLLTSLALYGLALVLLPFAVALIAMMTLYLVPTQLPFHLVDLTGAGPTTVGLAIALLNAVSAAVSLSFSRIRAHLSFPALTLTISHATPAALRGRLLGRSPPRSTSASSSHPWPASRSLAQPPSAPPSRQDRLS